MSYFETTSYLAGYHLAFILLCSFGILRYPRSKPQRWFIAGLLIQLLLNCQPVGDMPAFVLFFYLAVIALIFQGIIRLQASLAKR